MKAGYVGSSPTIVVPDGVDHYSSRLSAGWLGIGEHAVVRSPTTGFRYDLARLHERLEQLAASGQRPMMLVAYAGDSRTTTCDDFGALRAMCDDHGIWLHVDACHGTQLLFHREARSRLAGLSQADSITLDPHKVLTIPYAMSMLLVRDPGSLHAVARPEDIITGEAHSFGQITPFFGSRPFSSLKLYMMIKHLGLAGIEDMIDRRIALAQHLAGMVRQSEDLLLVNPAVEVNSVAFMYWPRHLRASTRQAADNCATMNELNEHLQKRLLRSGRAWLHNFVIPDSDDVLGLGPGTILRPLRYMSGNPATTINHVMQMISEVLTQGRAPLAEAPANELDRRAPMPAFSEA